MPISDKTPRPSAPVVGRDRVTDVPLCEHGDDATACQLAHQKPSQEAPKQDVSSYVCDVRAVQAAAWKNKLNKGFNTTDVPLEFCHLSAEVAEAFDAWRKGRADLGEELADVALFLVALAEMNGIDLQAEVEAKLTKNAARSYVTGVKGLPVRNEAANALPDPEIEGGADRG